MTLAYDRLLDALRSASQRVRQTLLGQANAQCPAHEDRNPSLSLQAIEGQVLLHCHAGCRTEDVLAMINMTMSDLFDHPRGATYRYDDGRIVHRTPNKQFRQSGNTQGPAQLYRASAVAEAVKNGVPVYLVEGEKDVHALEVVGAVGTTAPMGAGNWSRVDPSPLYGGTIMVVPDDDGAGQRWAEAVRASLGGKVNSLKFLAPRVGKDVADHIAAGHGLDDFQDFASDQVGQPARRAKLTRVSDIDIKPVLWAWSIDGAGRIPAGAVTIAAGREGTGKSSYGIWLSAQVTRGMLPGSFFGKPRKVFYLAVEDSWCHTIAPRLQAAGADLDLVYRFEVVTSDDEEVLLSLPYDNGLLEREVKEHDVALVVIDPLMSVMGDKIDTHRTREVRSALDPLSKLADRTGAVMLGIAHFNKSSGTDASTLLSGSHAFRDVPRAIFGFARDSDDTRVMTQTKNSLGRDDLPSLSYTIDNVALTTKHGITNTGKFTFTGESERSVADVLRDARGGDDERTERDEAASWLVDYLTANGGSGSARDAIKAAAGHGITKTTLTRARQRAGVRSAKHGMTGGWVWTLEESTEEPEESNNQTVGSSVPSVDSSGSLKPMPAQVDVCNNRPRAVDGTEDCLCGRPLTTFVQRRNGRCNRCQVQLQAEHPKSA